tara:strand:- start:120 stop:818 length:699 start_codon:yes stop_codon:yes gene_type:complete
MLKLSLLRVEPTIITDAQHWDGVQALLATSANAFTGLDRTAILEGLPVFAVGSAAASAAVAAGFTDVRTARNAQDMAAAVRQSCAPDCGLLVYRAGRDTARDLARMLSGFDLRIAEAYIAHPIDRLPPAIRRAIARGEVGTMIVYSARAAAAFVAACRHAGILYQARRIETLCLSQRIAARLRASGWRLAWGAPAPQADRLAYRLIGRRIASRPLSTETAIASAAAGVPQPT